MRYQACPAETQRTINFETTGLRMKPAGQRVSTGKRGAQVELSRARQEAMENKRWSGMRVSRNLYGRFLFKSGGIEHSSPEREGSKEGNRAQAYHASPPRVRNCLREVRKKVSGRIREAIRNASPQGSPLGIARCSIVCISAMVFFQFRPPLPTQANTPAPVCSVQQSIDSDHLVWPVVPSGSCGAAAASP